jgi:hypothetical protein
MNKQFPGNLPTDDIPFGHSQREAMRLASRQFSASDIPARCRAVGAVLEGQVITLPFMGKPLTLRLPGLEFSLAGEASGVPIWLQVLVLHHLNTSDGSTPTGELVAFRNLPGGQVYHSNFEKRVSQRLAREFGEAPSRLVEAARRLGGAEVHAGDKGAVVRAFPRVPLTMVVWKGDEEFAASGSVLLDSTVLGHLPIEDVVVTAQEAVSYLVREARPLRS